MEKDNLLNIEIGKVLRDLRLTAGMTQSKVAQYIGVTFQQVQKYEKGNNALSITKFIKFCNLFEISGDQLLKKTGVWFKHDKENPTGKQIKITEVSLEEITKDPTMRLDAEYWIKKKEEDEQKKD
jgi:transcriptional regulator with XRE-family HTH domain